MSKQPLGRGLASLIPQKMENKSEEAKNTSPAAAHPSAQMPPAKDEENRPPQSSPSANAVGGPQEDAVVGMPSSSSLRQALSKQHASTAPADRPQKESVFFVETEKVQPNPHQPRKDFDEEHLRDLAESIRRHGIIQPLIVTKHDQTTSRGHDVWYELIAGERRLRAAGLAGLKHVPVIIRDAHEEQKLEVALIENIQRHDLGALEEAKAFRKLMDVFGLSQQDVADRVGRSRSTIANTLRLLDLPQEVQQGLSEGKITEGHARALGGIKDPITVHALYIHAIEKSLSVREVEDLVRQAAVSAGTRKERQQHTADPEVKELQTKLAESLGTKVQVKGKINRGKIVVEFYSREELQNIIDKMAK
ncbi:MAG: ParB/RepB/Spo0J family partition protein [bacterium]|nr:ParB/RepB/Spo0J family partition protein [bacterium]